MVLVAQLDGEVTSIYPSIGELVGSGAPIMSVALMDKMWVTFNVREDHLQDFKKDAVITAIVPALNNQEVRLRVTNLKDVGSYAVWRATKSMGSYDLKTFAVKAVPVSQIKDLRPGMTVVLK